MRVWLVTIGEPLPFDYGNERLLRTGILAEMLARQGHSVVWWNSTFNHPTKQLRADRDTVVDVAPTYRVHMLHGGGYRRNISLRRILDHRRIAKRFTAIAPSEPRPDVILCSYPPLELSLAAVEYGRQNDVPVILDIRDLWPDIFVETIPRGLRFVARLAIRRLDRIAERACSGAFAIWGHVPAFVDWGVRHAGREATMWDRPFPFGYVSGAPAENEILASQQSWAELGVTSEKKELVVCYIGTVGHHVDLETVVDAAKLLRARRGIRFVICGAGDWLAAIERRAAGLPNVVFAGWRRRADVWTLLRLASIGVAPYKPRPDFIATISNKVPEYFSAGLPVALSLTSGLLHDLIRETGCGFSYGGDASRLAAQLVMLADSPERLQQLGQNAAAVFDDRFRAEKVYGEMIAALERVVDASRPSGDGELATSA
jgi:glycosyltransferase involved in cell wall biosynthesis